MGNWAIVIRGVGAHHNKDYAGDADKIAAKAVADLLAAGQAITEASFTSGACTDLIDDKPTLLLDIPEGVSVTGPIKVLGRRPRALFGEGAYPPIGARFTAETGARE